MSSQMYHTLQNFKTTPSCIMYTANPACFKNAKALARPFTIKNMVSLANGLAIAIKSMYALAAGNAFAGKNIKPLTTKQAFEIHNTYSLANERAFASKSLLPLTNERAFYIQNARSLLHALV